MSEENAQLARQVFDALNRGDVSGALDDMTADFVFDFSRSRSPELGLYGRDDIPRFWDAFAGVWESVTWEPEEFLESGDRLITPLTTVNRGRDGIEVRVSAAWLWSFRDRRISRITFFQDREDALAGE